MVLGLVVHHTTQHVVVAHPVVHYTCQYVVVADPVNPLAPECMVCRGGQHYPRCCSSRGSSTGQHYPGCCSSRGSNTGQPRPRQS